MAALKADDPTAQLQRVEFVGPQVGEELADERRARRCCMRGRSAS